MRNFHFWEYLSDEELLDMPLRELGLELAGSMVENCAEKLYRELEKAGLFFRPHIWISDEWFSPDGVPGIAIPFYLLHPRLIDLTKKMLGEAEGETQKWCMQLMRHECGHAIDNAFGLRKLRPRQKLFGATGQAYPRSYEFRPYSKRFVRHLKANYAQAHPDEDWAETFAVWLTPRSGWKKHYRGWKALEKLEMVDHIMSSLIGRSPLVKNKSIVTPINKSRMTLRSYYKKARRQQGIDKKEQNFAKFDRVLTPASESRKFQKASLFIGIEGKKIARQVAKEADQYQYRIDKMMSELKEHCKKRDLRLKNTSRRQLKVLLTKEAKKYVKDGEHRITM